VVCHPVHACSLAVAGRRPALSVWRIAVWFIPVSVLAACGNTTDLAVDEVGDSEPVLCAPDPSGSIPFPPIPVRAPPPGVTTGTVPHRQINTVVIPSVIADLHERVFGLSEVEPRESDVPGGGATAIWIRREINIGRPECILSGREVAHIHVDGSLHAVLPHGRIPNAESAGWIESHPWADLQPGFETLVLIFSPRSFEEVDVIFELILEGLTFVRGG